MFSTVVTAAICGIHAVKVTVEADVSDGMPLFSMVGFLASEVREAQDRVRTALKNTAVALPPKRITVSLAPADLRKSGSWYDLPISVSILAALGAVPTAPLSKTLFIGELSLSGQLLGVHGVMEMVSQAASFGCETCVVPTANLAEASVVEGVTVLGASSLSEIIQWMHGSGDLEGKHADLTQICKRQARTQQPDFADLRGQPLLRRSAEIAAAGLHNLLIIGPPGAGKTMAARRIPSILPPLSLEEMLEVSRIHSIAGTLPKDDGILTVRPFRAPHHTASPYALSGGGKYPHPGEVSLAHRGVLFLDELPEFRTEALETLRQPLEEGEIQISRLSGTYRFPASFMLIAAMNPCKCGYFPSAKCKCTPQEVRRYLRRISQPLLDRIDLCVQTQELSFDALRGAPAEESSASIRARVLEAHARQHRRYQGTTFHSNADLNSRAVQTFCTLGLAQEGLLRQAWDRLHLSGRSYTGILRVARTIADLDGSDAIETHHLAEAISGRMPDQRFWNGEALGSQ